MCEVFAFVSLNAHLHAPVSIGMRVWLPSGSCVVHEHASL